MSRHEDNECHDSDNVSSPSQQEDKADGKTESKEQYTDGAGNEEDTPGQREKRGRNDQKHAGRAEKDGRPAQGLRRTANLLLVKAARVPSQEQQQGGPDGESGRGPNAGSP